MVNGSLKCIECANGDRSWSLNGEFHREDGPAREWYNGHIREWWWHGKRLKVSSQEEFEKLKPLLLVEDVQNG